ncbi:hypothetical protein CCHL11_05203 [Colletotrichum chlorophyti]|uniref:Uncharacterized protein n=1 Tax=Colletotrichum chlorophyti TaxID=708187 RepID=A0A1Q8RP01_9PEZI|nr:hypothetical protein CCHL11_05203 [Colletotrichum chlorophyti]
MPQHQRYVEPQYDQVPIPRGYAAVHGEGGVAPSPYNIGRPSPPTQYPPHQIPLIQQPWSQPTGTQMTHHSEASMYNPQGAKAQGQQQAAHGDIQSVAPSDADRRISTVSYLSNNSQTSHGAQPGFSVTSTGVLGSPQHHYPQRQDPEELRLVSDGNGQDATSHPQFGQQNVTTPPQQQGFTPSNTTNPRFAPPQGQQVLDEECHGPRVANVSKNKSNTGDAIQRTPNARISLLPQAQGPAVDSASISGSNSRSVSPGTQTPADRNITPEPLAASVSAEPRPVTNTKQTNRETRDDIYDSTPRLPSGSSPAPVKPIIETRTGQSTVSLSSADEASQTTSHANGNANGSNSTMITRGKSTRAELEDTEDERKRTIRQEAQEEKILVDPYEELQSGGLKFRKDDDPEAPQMSATSYPGQEWNPYVAGGYEDWD